jgi:hypothetical protein
MAKDQNNKIEFISIPKRFEVVTNDQEGIINYDLDNLYPQRMKLLASSSVTATSCLRLMTKFMRGKGFIDENFGSAILNQQEQSSDEILDEAAEDYADYGGVCLHFDYNGLLEIIAIRVVPFEYTRIASPDSDHAGKIAIYPDWEQSTGNIERKLIQYVDRFTTNKDIILKQIQDSGGIENWNGHVLWFSNKRRKYPVPAYDSAINDIQTDAEISFFKKNNAETSFLASHFFLYKGEFEDDQERERYADNLRQFQGGKEAGKFMLIDGITDENIPEVIKIDVANNDRLFEYHEESSNNKIRKSFLAPRELIGDDAASGFDTEVIDQARAYYNSITEDLREDLSKIFSKFIPFFHQSINEANNYQIKELFHEQAPDTEV